jgi:ketosteroid isomerase-like protein
MVDSSHAGASDDSDKAEIVALNRHIADAIGRGDLDTVMASYVDAKDYSVAL